MKVSISIGAYNRVDVVGMVDYIQQAEKLGVTYAWSAEAWGHAAVTSLGYLAEKTKKIMKTFENPCEELPTTVMHWVITSSSPSASQSWGALVTGSRTFSRFFRFRK